MPTITIESSTRPDGVFPDETNMRIEWVSEPYKRGSASGYKERHLVWSGEVSGQITRNFDPGKYSYKAHRGPDAGEDGFREYGEFLVGMTEEQWRKICFMQPKMQKLMMTSEGVIYTCQFPGCNKRNTSKVSSLLHETGVHYGVNLLNAEDPTVEKRSVDKQIAKLVQDKKNEKQQEGPRIT